MAMFSNAWQSFSKIYWWEVFLTLSQSFSMKTRFMLESALSGFTHYVRSIPITLSVKKWHLGKPSNPCKRGNMDVKTVTMMMMSTPKHTVLLQCCASVA